MLTPLVVVVAVRYAPEVPRLVYLLQPMLLAIYMGGSRALYRTWKEFRLYGGLRAQGQPVLVLGGGEAAVNLVRDLSRSAEWRVVGLLDDTPGHRGREIHGCEVLGGIADLDRLVRRDEGRPRDHRDARGGPREAPGGGQRLRAGRGEGADPAGDRGRDDRPGQP